MRAGAKLEDLHCRPMSLYSQLCTMLPSANLPQSDHLIRLSNSAWKHRHLNENEHLLRLTSPGPIPPLSPCEFSLLFAYFFYHTLMDMPFQFFTIHLYTHDSITTRLQSPSFQSSSSIVDCREVHLHFDLHFDSRLESRLSRGSSTQVVHLLRFSFLVFCSIYTSIYTGRSSTLRFPKTFDLHFDLHRFIYTGSFKKTFDLHFDLHRFIYT
ncbi:hypothetical protein L6452_20763 [Arctium lappa]|uniref:Uncharacterized protein n=1 Tax=Arctium lappa TaxID=4217 RepID=A0ACB9BD34_ARCLA|nr:hypothetical protein L6452_20763 [Arctium lappa]